MKLVSYQLKEKNSDHQIGFMIDRHVIDVQNSYQLLLLSQNQEEYIESIDAICPADPTAFFKVGNPAIEKAQEAYDYITQDLDQEGINFDRDEVSLGTPISNPGKIICIGRNYADHAAEMKSELPKYPVLFAKFANALIGPEDVIEKSALTEKLDYEVELTIVIGKEASQVSRVDAKEYIAGYTIGNDTTARDLQKRTPQWLQGKTLDRSTPIGPWIVTADEIKDPANLSIRSYVNGEKRQDSNTSQLIFDIPFLIEFISALITLQPRDMILTGTPEGVGVAMDPPHFLQDGDIVKLEIEQIGEFENKVVNKK